jgi:hypothetical protein
MNNSRKIFEFKRLIWKIFRNKDLARTKPLKMALGQASRAVLEDGLTSSGPNPVFIIAHGELEVCDGEHRSFVMKMSGIRLRK